MTRISACFFICFTLILSSFSYSNDGWDCIKNNDHVTAKKIFLEDLAQDSLNEKALKGMLFICDIEENYYDHYTYVHRLLKYHYTNELYEIYENNIKWKHTEIIENEKIAERFKVDAKLKAAYELKAKRKFEECNEAYRKIINPFEWSYLGPFKNINGYGHVIDFEPEKDTYLAQKTYLNKDNTSLQWLIPPFSSPTSKINYGRHLNSDPDGSTYFFNTFFTTEKDENASLAITRKYPIKIWLDNQLIFENKEFINDMHEAEEIHFNLKKGNHRIFIKYSVSSYFTGISNTYNRSYKDYGFRSSLSTNSTENSYFQSYSARKTSNDNNDLIVRLLNTNHQLIPIVSSHSNTQIDKGNLQTTVSEKTTISFYEKTIKEQPNEWFNYYLLSKAYLKYGLSTEIEKYFVNITDTSQATFFKYIMFGLYQTNGKKEKGYLILNNIDQNKTPIFSILEKELDELDSEHDEEKYLVTIQKLLAISPAHKPTIKKLLKYYDSKGLTKERIAFAKTTITQYPEYEYSFEDYTLEDYKPGDSDIGKEEKKYDPKKDFKELKKENKKEYNYYTYNELIKKYKARENHEKVLELYDDYLLYSPYYTYMRQQKALYLFNIEKYDEAIKEIELLLQFNPHSEEYYELLGDIYKDQNNDSLALNYYLKAKSYSHVSSSYYSRNSSSLKEKIEKIEGQKALKNKFDTPEIASFLKNNEIPIEFQDEESLIRSYTTDVFYNNDGIAYLYGKMLIEILTEAGANSWTQYDFRRLGNLQYIKVIKPNGAELFPDKSGSYVVFKNLEPKDKIIMETYSSHKPSNELGNELSSFQFMSFHAPILYAKFEVALSKQKELYYSLHKLNNTVIKSEKEDFTYYKWEYQNIPKLYHENGILDQWDIYANIQYSTIKDWTNIVDWYKAKTYRKLEMNYEIQNILDSIIKPNMSENEKTIAVYNFITRKITYSFTKLLQSGYIPKNTELTCSGKIGDCKDVATLMIAMLRASGMEAYYVLVKTNSMFHLKTLPGLYFDHVIAGVVIDGKMEFFDLTTDYYPHYVINENDVNAYALLIKDGEKELFQLPNDYLNKNKNLIEHHIDAKMNLDHSLEMSVKTTMHGMRGGHLREVIHNKTKADLKNEVLESFGKGVFKNLELVEYKFHNSDSITAPLASTTSLKAIKHSDNVLDIYFLKAPYMIGVASNASIFNDLRHNTLNLVEITEIAPSLQTIELHFPKGMKLYKMPENIIEKSRFGYYSVQFKKMEDGIKIIKHQEFYKSEISIEDFAEFKKYYLKLVDHEHQKIVMNNK